MQNHKINNEMHSLQFIAKKTMEALTGATGMLQTLIGQGDLAKYIGLYWIYVSYETYWGST